METGQETAPELLQFLNDLRCQNVKVNFDPANMILYGAGDPIEAIASLGRHIGHVHVKDATLSDAARARRGATEVPFGTGQVPPKEFLRALDDVGYTGPLAIEREAGDDAHGRHRVRDRDAEEGGDVDAMSRLASSSCCCCCCPLADSPTPRPRRQLSQQRSRKSPSFRPRRRASMIEQDVTYLDPDRKEKLDLYLPANRDRDNARPPSSSSTAAGGSAATRRRRASSTSAPRSPRPATSAASVNYSSTATTAGRRICSTARTPSGSSAPTPTKYADRRRPHRRDRRLGGRASGADGRVHERRARRCAAGRRRIANVSDRVRCVVDLYGITDLLTRRKTDEQGNPLAGDEQGVPLLPNDDGESDPDAWQLASPVAHVAEETRRRR